MFLPFLLAPLKLSSQKQKLFSGRKKYCSKAICPPLPPGPHNVTPMHTSAPNFPTIHHKTIIFTTISEHCTVSVCDSHVRFMSMHNKIFGGNPHGVLPPT